MLDIGCGIGRVARPLTTYLNKEGAYIGFDVVPSGIKWCQRNYTAFPNFHFHYIPLKNDLYNLSTDAEPATFTFPYRNESFDLVVSVSVFTHMQQAGVKRYMSEIFRVLKPGRYCFCTFFLITPESDRYLKESKHPFFSYRYADFFLHDASVKDANIAYRYEVIEKMITASKLTIKSFHPGWWAGKAKAGSLDYQDVLIIMK